MARPFSHPRLVKHPQDLQLSYELSHRLHTAKVYPFRSPNGSTIIIYGHENGVKIVWRGGRPFKAPQASRPASPKKTNGTNAIISLDSDNEEESKPAFVDKPEFEDIEEDLDPLQPYPSILQDLDIHFGTDVLHLALLPATAFKAGSPASHALEPVKQKLVFAASCADNAVRLVTLPLTPPSPLSKARPEFRQDFTNAIPAAGSFGEKVTVLAGHQKPSDGVSMTVDSAGSSKDLVKADSSAAFPIPSLIIASHSQEVTGRLLLFRVPIASPKTHVDPFQSIYLTSPARSISFSPGEHSSHLLVAEAAGSCRIYDYRQLFKTPSTDEPHDSAIAEQGTWLISLYAGFQNMKSDPQASQRTSAHAGFGRKTILDAQWVSAGQAIIVLLNDGEWAIWDIQGQGPGASRRGLGVLGPQGIKGGSRSEYSLTGYIDGAAKPRPSGPPQITNSKFVPMTPGTRRSTEPFSGRGSSGSVRGQISVVELPSASTSAKDECVLFWLGESYAVIPSLTKYWAAHAGKSGGSGTLFNGAAGARMIRLDTIDLQGERCSGIEQITKPSGSTGLPTDIVILGEHRMAIMSTGKLTKDQRPAQKETRLTLVSRNGNGNAVGDLSVVGIEQALDRMDNGALGTKRKMFRS